MHAAPHEVRLASASADRLAAAMVIPPEVDGLLMTPGGLHDALQRAAASRPDHGVSFVLDDETERFVSYPELMQRATVRLGALERSGLKAGDPVILLAADSAEFVINFWACVLGGMVAAPLAQPPSFVTPNDALLKAGMVWDLLHRPYVLAEESTVARAAESQALAEVTLLAPAALDDERRPGTPREPGSLDETVLIQFSSGSTGNPKGVVLTHRNLLTNMEAIIAALRAGPEDTVVTWMPYHHDMGLIGFHLSCIGAALHQVHIPPISFVKSPALWLRKMHEHRATISGSPNFGYQLVLDRVAEDDLASLDLRSVRVILNGAEPISWALLRAFEDRLAPCGLRRNAVLPVYGMAEASLAVTFTPCGGPAVCHALDREIMASEKRAVDTPEGARAAHVVDEGYPVAGCAVRIVGEDDVTLPERCVGHIQIRGKNVTSGYYENPKANAESFVDGWLRTGDLGFMHAGRLSVTGRAKDIIFVNGQNFFAFDVEDCASSVPGVAERKVAAAGWHDDRTASERVALFLSVDPDRKDGSTVDDVCRRVCEHIGEVMGISIDVLVPVKRMPKTTSGKVKRYQLLQQLLEGKFDDVKRGREALFDLGPRPASPELQAPAGAPAPAEGSARVVAAAPVVAGAPLEETLRRLVSEVLGVPVERVGLDDSFRSLGGTSLKAVQLLSRMEREFEATLAQRLLVECKTLRALAAALPSAIAGGRKRNSGADPRGPSEVSGVGANESIAVIAMAGRFPGSRDVDELWGHLLAGDDLVGQVPTDRWPADRYFSTAPCEPGLTTSRWGGFVEDPYAFDPSMFGMPPDEAFGVDPQQRMFLDVAREVLERAGYLGRRSAKQRIGVFVGASQGAYLEHCLRALTLADLQQLRSMPGLSEASRAEVAREWERAYGRMPITGNTVTDNLVNMTAARTSHVFDLRGPSLVLDTACSSSLVAVHMACESLRRGECESAIAGGVSLLLTPTPYLLFAQAGALSPSGRCKAFDASADGFVPGEGAAAVLLKPLSRALADGDTILAVIKGSAVNNDGSSLGVMAPNPDGQVDVIRSVYRRFGIHPRDVGYVESHGTGTVIGDPIEVRALSQAFLEFTPDRQYCAIGSIKSNIGHLLSAAGVAGLIKAILSVNEGRVPRTLHVAAPNPAIGFERTPFFVATQSADWQAPSGKPRRAAINSFGFGGTNCHMVVEEAPRVAPRPAPRLASSEHLLCLSAHDDSALERRAQQLAARLAGADAEEVADVCFTVNARRPHAPVRRAVTAAAGAMAASVLAASAEAPVLPEGSPRLALMFTGQGSQYPGMARGLYDAHGAFRAFFDEAAAHFERLDAPLQSLVFGKDSDAERLARTGLTQLATFAVDYAVGRLLLEWGLQPACVLGHSVGELVAACVSGVMDLKDAARLVEARARLMQELPSNGAMAAVFASPEVVAERLAKRSYRVVIAAYNGAHQVVSGLATDLDAFLTEAERAGISCKRLRVSHAFHSPLMEPIVAPFRRILEDIQVHAPKIPLLSNSDGGWVTGAAMGPDYWIRHALGPVCFEQCVRTALAAGCTTFVEAGPDRTLSGLCRPLLRASRGAIAVPTLQRTAVDWPNLLRAVGTLYERGFDVDFDAIHRCDGARQVSLPAYPQLRISMRPAGAEGNPSSSPPWAAWLHEWRWLEEPAAALPRDAIGHAVVFARPEDLPALAVAGPRFGCTWTIVTERQCPAVGAATVVTIDPASPSGYLRVLEAAASRGAIRGVVYLWGLPSQSGAPETREAIERLLRLARALVATRQGLKAAPLPLLVATCCACAVADEDAPKGLSASPLASVGQTLAMEEASLACRVVDLDSASPDSAAYVEGLLAELCAAPNEERLVARRGGRRLKRALERSRAADRRIALDDGDTLLLVGASTGIGADLAVDLAKRARVNLVITGRRPPPVSTDPVDAARSDLLGALKAHGGGVRYEQADAGDAVAMSGVVRRAREAFGPIRGVVHCAGVVDHKTLKLLSKSEASIRDVLYPKMQGIRVLDEVTAGEPLKFFAAFSSVAASRTTWGKALGDYAAANFYLDQYCAARRSRRGSGASVAINWSLWSARGIAKGAGIDAATLRGGLRALDPALAVGAFYDALSLGPSVVHVFDEVAPPAVAQAAAAKRAPARPNSAPGASHPVTTTRVDPSEASGTHFEMSQLVREVLGASLHIPADQVDPSRSFRDLGLDSAAAVEALAVLGRRLGRALYPTLMLEFERPQELVDYLAAGAPQPAATVADAPRPGNDIAIVGFACRVPGADDADAFWQMLVEGRSAITEAPRERFADCYLGDGAQGSHTSYSRWGGFLAAPYAFDAMFFGISPREAACMDPQQRLFLEVAWDAMQQAGYARKRPRSVGVFVGAENNMYVEHFINHQRFEEIKARLLSAKWFSRLEPRDQDALFEELRQTLAPAEITSDVVPGNGLNEIAARVSHVFDLEGPSMIVNSACSSSLVALHWACESLRKGESQMAIVGGVNLNLGTTSLVFLSKLKALSPDGDCAPFDARANGMVIGEGAAALVLKPLDRAVRDGDTIHAVIKGSAINNDGHSQGITVPTARGQAAAIRSAYESAGVDPATVTYVECHGTATPLGDPVEVQGLALAFGQSDNRKQPCVIGSVKSSIGHLLSASGGPSLIKAVMAMKHQAIPPTFGYRQPNPHINFAATPFTVAAGQVAPWESVGPRRAGVNAFGFGGTNAHVVLEEYIARAPAETAVLDQPDVLLLSARTPAALRAMAGRLAAHLAAHREVSLQSLCHSANRGQRRMAWQAALVASDRVDLMARLQRVAAEGPEPQWMLARSNPRRGPGIRVALRGDLSLRPDALASVTTRFPRFEGVMAGMASDVRGLGVYPATGRLASFLLHYTVIRFLEHVGLQCERVECAPELQACAAYFSGDVTFSEMVGALGCGPNPGLALATIEERRPRSEPRATKRPEREDEDVVVAIGGPSVAGEPIRLAPEGSLLLALLECIGRIHVAGAAVDGDALHDGRCPRVPIPGYPFERATYRAFEPGRPAPEKPARSGQAIGDAARRRTQRLLLAELEQPGFPKCE